MIRKAIFVLAHEMGDPSFFATYRKLQKGQWRPYDELRLNQEKQLRALIAYAYDQVPYYRRLFKDLHLVPKDIRVIEDLEKVPVLTKEIIKADPDAFVPSSLARQRYDTRATGGSSGTPLQYRLSKQDRFLGAALLYRGWGYGGYELGDRMVFLAGSSLAVGPQPWLNKHAHEFARNIRKLSSFDMADAEMRRYADLMNSFNPRFLRGYPSSIYFFARWLRENDARVPDLGAVFTTSEKLLPDMRETIGDVFGCQVYDNYGLNDGGLGAYECSDHCGLHIDTERAVMEVVDQDYHQISEGDGAILATSLYNYAMPLIRYSTDDLATLSDAECGCGRHSRLLTELVGRSVDIFVTPERKNIHGWFFLYIFWTFNKGIREFQVAQNSLVDIDISLVIDDIFDEAQLESISNLIHERGPGWNVKYHYVDRIERTRAGKYKFIINNLGK